MVKQVDEIYSVFKEYPTVCTDSRKIIKNAIFFALKGDNFNGNEFAERALKDGCAYAVIDDPKFDKGNKYLLVDDALKMLQALAKLHRSLLTIPVIAITGSNGKTTTKELVNAVLSKKYRAHATHGNLNNHIGVPLTLLSITDEAEIAVIEMGANHLGEITLLCEIAEPAFGIITNIGKAHLEGFGSATNIIKAKGELYQYLKMNSGRAFVNCDDQVLMNLGKSLDLCTYGSGNYCHVTGKLIASDAHITFSWKSKKDSESIDQKEKVVSGLTGKYNFENILAAICIGNYFNVSANDINRAIEEYVSTNNRSQVVKKGTNVILLDAYNANPNSMTAAIENFSETKATKKIVVLGDMLELGSHSQEEHKRIIELLQSKKLDQVVLVGPVFMKEGKSSKFKIFPGTEEASKYLKQQKLKNAHILIKGSRGIKLETLADVL